MKGNWNELNCINSVITLDIDFTDLNTVIDPLSPDVTIIGQTACHRLAV